MVVFVVTRSLAATFPIGGIELIRLLDPSVTLGTLFAGALTLYLFFALAWTVREVLSKVILPRSGADPGVSNTIQSTTHYAIIAIGILSAISIVGFDLSALAIIGGGLSVGLGFGLQELVGNFVSTVVPAANGGSDMAQVGALGVRKSIRQSCQDELPRHEWRGLAEQEDRSSGLIS